MVFIGILLAAIVLFLLVTPRRARRKGEPFDWTYRRPWWRPRWAFPDNR
jgi:hypothetical protein